MTQPFLCFLSSSLTAAQLPHARTLLLPRLGQSCLQALPGDMQVLRSLRLPHHLPRKSVPPLAFLGLHQWNHQESSSTNLICTSSPFHWFASTLKLPAGPLEKAAAANLQGSTPQLMTHQVGKEFLPLLFKQVLFSDPLQYFPAVRCHGEISSENQVESVRLPWKRDLENRTILCLLFLSLLQIWSGFWAFSRQALCRGARARQNTFL